MIFSIDPLAIITFGASHVFTSAIVGDKKVYTVTAGDDNITIA